MIRTSTRLPRITALLCASLSTTTMATVEARATGNTPQQQPAVRADPPVIPPRIVSEVAIEYPSGASGDAVVVLAVTVNADGTVRMARVLEGGEPFATTAAATVQALRFEPATRAGRAISAIIRLEVSFKAPVLVPQKTPPGKPDAAGSSPGNASPKATTTVSSTGAVEVQVVGERAAPMVATFERAEIRQLPGAFGDPFRAIEALPGVTPIVSGLPFFYVRGAPPGNVGYFFDGVRVPYLYHVGLGPSVVHPGMVDRVDLYPGGYPARYGRFTGAIVTGDATAPRDDFHAEGNIRLFDAGALAEGGFANDRGTLLVGGRYSYTATILSLIVKDTTLDYRDFQTRVTYDLTRRDRLTAFGFGSYDLLGQTAGGVRTIPFGSEFYRLDARYDHSFGTDSTLRLGASLGFDQTRFLDQRNAQDRMLGTRVELRHPLSKTVTLRAGGDVVRDGYTIDKSSYVDPEDPILRHYDDLFPQRTDLALGAWTDLVLDVAKGVQVTPGVRVDLFSSGGVTSPGVDPRISARFAVTDHVRIVHAYGVVHQSPTFLVPVPGLVPGGLKGGLQTSLQASAGVEADLPEAITATATVFDDIFFNMSDVLGVSTGDVTENIDRRALGSTMGFELFIRRNLSQRLGGFLTYTLSRSTRSVPAASIPGLPPLPSQHFPSAFDRTHVANAALAYNLGRNWRAGTRLVFYTGGPKIVRYEGATPPPPSAKPDREAPFYRLDLRLEKRWNLGKTSWLAFVVELLNATFHTEVVQGEEIGPVTIPSIGLEGGI